MFDDGVNAASPFVAREAQCELKRCAHQRHSENSDQGRCASEARSRQGQTTAEATQNIIFGDADFLEVELRQEVRTVPHGIDRTLEDQARCGALHDQDRNAPFGRGIRIGSAKYG